MVSSPPKIRATERLASNHHELVAALPRGRGRGRARPPSASTAWAGSLQRDENTRAMLYVHNLSPYIVRFQVGGHTIAFYWYGFAYAVGFMLCYETMMRAAARQQLANLTAEAVERTVLGIVVGVVAGGRLGFMLQHLDRLLADPSSLFRSWEGGMTFFGGLVGAMLGVWWTTRHFGVSFWSLLDLLSLPASAALGIGRIANFINGELVGLPTRAGWGVIFPRVDRQPRHPSQLYESASHFVTYAILWWLASHMQPWVERKPGRLWWAFLALYGLLRALTDFFRADDAFVGPLSTGQWASLVVFAIAMACLVLRKPSPADEAPQAA
jgi:phosphatidylglycerol---prolipoprotein diacylglyceryl transferase